MNLVESRIPNLQSSSYYAMQSESHEMTQSVSNIVLIFVVSSDFPCWFITSFFKQQLLADVKHVC